MGIEITQYCDRCGKEVDELYYVDFSHEWNASLALYEKQIDYCLECYRKYLEGIKPFKKVVKNDDN